MKSKIIEEFKPSGGNHCITNSLKQIFEYYGYPIKVRPLKVRPPT
jgi:hypothetical protein